MHPGPLILIIALGSLLGCSENAEDLAIKDYVQMMGKSKLQLDVKIVKNEQVGEVLARDSIAFIDSMLFNAAQKLKLDYQSDEVNLLSRIEYQSVKLKYANTAKEYGMAKATIDTMKGMIWKMDSVIAKIDSGKYDIMNNETKLLSSARSVYSRNPDHALAFKYRCKYSLISPTLGGVRQELDRVFVLDTLRRKVLAVVD